MRNPLNRRLPRELAKDWAKYAAIFILMVLLISICSGMRVSNESLKKAYYDSFEKYTLEDGHITFDKPLPDDIRTVFEEKGAMKLYDNFYYDESADDIGAVIRIFGPDDGVNTPCLLSGELPSAENEIAIDRVFAKNNDISVGDTINLDGRTLNITGFIALPDYSTLFESNTDSMFDSVHFSVAVMSESGINMLESRKLKYNYAWLYSTAPADDIEAAVRSDKFLDLVKDELTDYGEEIVKAQVEVLTNKLETAGKEYADLYEEAIKSKLTEVSERLQTGAAEYTQIYMTTGSAPSKSDLSVSVDDYEFSLIESTASAVLSGNIDKTDIIALDNYIPRYLNQAVTFSIDDIGGDEAGTMVMCYMMIGLIAFIFAVTISNTITAEAGVIGTLRASGFTKGELIRHYMVLPVVVTLVAAVVGMSSATP